MTQITTDPTSLTNGIDKLLADLHAHEQAAREIRASLMVLRKRIASGGKRAGAKARSGRKLRVVEPASESVTGTE